MKTLTIVLISWFILSFPAMFGWFHVAFRGTNIDYIEDTIPILIVEWILFIIGIPAFLLSMIYCFIDEKIYNIKHK